MMQRRMFLFWLFLAFVLMSKAQQYAGMQGLIHVPTAVMDSAGVARVGLHYVPKEMIPDGLTCDGEKFSSLTNYLSITPFSWIQIGYGYTLWKLHRNHDKSQKTGFYAKDRYFSLYLQPLKEGRYWPSLVVGGNDVWGSGDDGQSGSNFYRNFFAAASKHFSLGGNQLGAHLAYRHWKRDYNSKWNGVVGGLTVRPSFYKNLRVIGEWDGAEVNIGADCLLFKCLLVQCALQECRNFTGGVSLYLHLR
jgi:hypothetical protein